MNNSSIGYLNAINASMLTGPPAPTSSQMPDVASAAPAPMPPPPPGDNFGLGLSKPGVANISPAAFGAPAPQLPPAPPGSFTGAGGFAEGNGAPGGPVVKPAPPPPPGAPPPVPTGGGMAEPEAPAFPLVRSGGSGVANVAAKETELRGPQLLQAQGARNAALAGAAQTVGERQNEVAAFEFAHALDQENRANARQDAAQYSTAARADELRQRQNDFDDSVQALSKMSVDPDRFWASRSTAQKIAGFLSVSLGGFFVGRTGRNPGLEMMNQAIDRDIDAQKFAFQVQRDASQQKQTAFGMAMQKYQNVDAASAMARAAAIDSIQAQLAQAAALQKGTDAENRATAMIAQLQDDKMQQIAQGVAFTPAHQVAVGGTYVDPTTGLKYSDKEAKELAKEYRGYGAEIGKLNAQGSNQLYLEKVKAGMKKGEESDKGAAAISSQLQQAGVPQARAAAERARAALTKSKGGAVDSAVRGVAGQRIGNAVLGADSAEREQAYADFSNASIKAMMGNATEAEVDRARAGLGQASDPEARLRAIDAQLKILDSIEKNAKAGQSPESQSEFDRRRENASGHGRTVPTGAKQGW